MNVDIPEKLQFLFEPMRHKVIHGGRGSTKSWSAGRTLVLNSLDHHERILCAREYQASIKESAKKLIENQIVLMGVEDYFEVKRDEIICKLHDSSFLFGGLWHNPQKIKSMEGITKAWVEEANTVSQESLDYLIPTIREPDSEIWYTFNRKHESDPVDAMFLGEHRRENAIVQQINFDDNPFFPKVLKDEMEWDKKHDNEKYLHVWKGLPLKYSESRVFKKWRVDGSIAPGEGDTLYYGADWGFANDPTALVRCWIDHKKRELYIDYEAYGVGVEIEDTPAMFDRVPGSRKWKITADSARPETISHMKRKGFRMDGAKKGKGSVEEGIEFLKSYTLVIHERCKHVIDELGLYSYKVDKHTGDILPILADLHNHCIDAIRYAFEQLAFRKTVIHIG